MKKINKAIEYLLGYLLLGFSFLIPRNKNRWVVGGAFGFEGNAKFFYLEASESKDECYWISSNKEEIKNLQKLNLKAYYCWSLKGLYLQLTAGKYIYSSYISEINRWTFGRAKKVNLWHGIGLKNVEFKIKTGYLARIYDPKNIKSRIHNFELFVKPDLLLSTSPFMTKQFAECFRISENKCIEAEYPRCKVFNWEKEKLIAHINKYEPVVIKELLAEFKKYKKVYIYMPTWRDSFNDFTASFDFEELNNIFREKGYLLLLKLHPNSPSIIKEDYSNIFLLSNLDLYPLLPFTDVLITDYSSVYYDYILMKDKQVLLFPFDKDEYIKNSRDLAFDYDEYTPGKKVYSFSELIQVIKEDQPLLDIKIDKIKKVFWDFSGLNLYEEIQKL